MECNKCKKTFEILGNEKVRFCPFCGNAFDKENYTWNLDVRIKENAKN